ncbi:hypothetical protein [Streptomyces sp. NPDC051554]
MMQLSDPRRLIPQNPAGALRAVEDVVLAMHSGVLAATGPARDVGVTFEDVGRALALVDEALRIKPAWKPGLVLVGPPIQLS